MTDVFWMDEPESFDPDAWRKWRQDVIDAPEGLMNRDAQIAHADRVIARLLAEPSAQRMTTRRLEDFMADIPKGASEGR